MLDKIRMPEVITRKTDELEKLVTKYPDSIPLCDAAAFFHMKPEALRNSIERCLCPFGFCWLINENGNRGFKIPTVTFFFWVLNMNGPAA